MENSNTSCLLQLLSKAFDKFSGHSANKLIHRIYKTIQSQKCDPICLWLFFFSYKQWDEASIVPLISN